MRSFFRLSLLFFFFYSTSPLFAEPKIQESQDSSSCASELVNQDLSQRYRELRSRLEDQFDKGETKKMREAVVKIRRKIDDLSLEFLGLKGVGPALVNSVAQETLDQVDQLIALWPKLRELAPQVRSQYVVPLTNLSAEPKENESCLMNIAVSSAKLAIQNDETNVSTQSLSSIDIYRGLTKELTQLNDQLYILQTSSVQPFISVRSQIIELLRAYNQDPQQLTNLGNQVPGVLNIVQREIETIMPGLQLSKEYYSLAE